MKRFGGLLTPLRGRNASPGDYDEYAPWDAAYVLGSLSSAERSEYQAHLKTCPSCRQAVAELSCMPAPLSRLDGEDMWPRSTRADLRAACHRCPLRC